MRANLDWRSLFRRWLGPSETETKLRATIADLTARIAQIEEWGSRDRTERDRAYQRAKLAEKSLRRIQREVLDSLALVEPPMVEGCVKVRMHTEAEAIAFAERLAADLGIDSSVLNAYRCKVCPRHPGTMDRFWHVGHRDPQVKPGHVSGEIHRRRAWREGRTIGQLVTPETAARLRESTSEGDTDEDR